MHSSESDSSHGGRHILSLEEEDIFNSFVDRGVYDDLAAAGQSAFDDSDSPVRYGFNPKVDRYLNEHGRTAPDYSFWRDSQPSIDRGHMEDKFVKNDYNNLLQSLPAYPDPPKYLETELGDKDCQVGTTDFKQLPEATASNILVDESSTYNDIVVPRQEHPYKKTDAGSSKVSSATPPRRTVKSVSGRSSDLAGTPTRRSARLAMASRNTGHKCSFC